MRKIYVEHLPKYRGGVSWKNSVGQKVKYEYDDIVGEVTIKSYDGKKYLILTSKEYGDFRISIGNFGMCKLGNMLNKYNYDFIYNVGDEVLNTVITKQLIRQLKERNVREYSYVCNVCDNEDTILEDNIKRAIREGTKVCNVCANKKVKVGYNDIATTHPSVAQLFANIDDAKRYVSMSNKKVTFKCPHCLKNQNKVIHTVVTNGFKCEYCRNTKSYPERVILYLLQALNVEFDVEVTFEWSKGKVYDFYIPSMNMIIESHGIQHFEEVVNFKKRTLEEEQENDRLKETLAKNNNISNYVVIDCRHSNIDWISKNILKSELSKTFDLSNIKWEEINNKSTSSQFKEVCKLWNDGMSLNEITEAMKMSKTNIRKYLKLATESSICNYSTNEARRRASLYSKNKKQI